MEFQQKYIPNNNWSNVDALERERKMLIRSKESFEPENENNLEKNKKIDAEIIKLDKEIATERNRITCKIAEINTIPKVKNSEWNTLSELNSSLALQTFQNGLKEIKKNLNVAKGKIQEEILPKWASENGAKYSPSQKNSIRRIGKIINQINENYYLQSTRKEKKYFKESNTDRLKLQSVLSNVSERIIHDINEQTKLLSAETSTIKSIMFEDNQELNDYLKDNETALIDAVDQFLNS